jgi:hypothetical protein
MFSCLAGSLHRTKKEKKHNCSGLLQLNSFSSDDGIQLEKHNRRYITTNFNQISPFSQGDQLVCTSIKKMNLPQLVVLANVSGIRRRAQGDSAAESRVTPENGPNKPTSQRNATFPPTLEV